ncbi:MAG: ankyrin repeat domain-containing protein [Pseudomonadota bacterium]
MDFEAHQREMNEIMDALEKAVLAGDQSQVEALFARQEALTREIMGYDVFEPDQLKPEYAALREAIDSGELDTIRDALTPDLDLNQPQGKYDSVPLFWALTAEGRSPDVVRLLLDHGADAAHTTSEGYTPLHYIPDANFIDASVKAPYEIAKLLVDAGADIEATQHWGWTPLMRAITEGVAVELEALLLAGANPDVIFPPHTQPEFQRGMTTLMAAGQDTVKVRLLLDHGADPRFRGAHETPLRFFKRNSDETAARLASLESTAEDTPFDHDYANGYAASLSLIQVALQGGAR